MPENRPMVDRRGFLKGSGAVLVGGSVSGSRLLTRPAAAAPAGDIAVTHGVAAGDVTAESALVWCRASGPGRMQVVYGTHPGRVAARGARHSRSVPLEADHDFIGQVTLDGLEPGSRYYYQVVVRDRGHRAVSGVASFSTAPRASDSADVRFVWSADTGQGMAHRPPFPAFSAMAAESPAFFIFNGDTIYGDTTTPVGGPARSVPDYWAKYKENRADPLLQQLLAHTPVIVNWDDHEVVNDFRGPVPLMPVGRAAFHDYWPLSVGPERIHRSLGWGRSLEVFVLDGRQYADPLEQADQPGKSMLGEEQRQWLIDGVTRSQATWKVLVTSSPLSIIRSAKPPQDDFVAYEWELGEILSAFRDAGVRNLVWLTADVHWAQSIHYPDHRMWEFVGCPAGANPRTAPRPLSPTFGPQETFLGLNERYYGAVAIDASAGTMTVDLKVENGDLRHRQVIRAE
ncbi:MAG: alkaline phosphatase D family protein [Actinobacteria bacterium]|nr:alkaline phosphatase D family protein [Actinomycetota bacterium]